MLKYILGVILVLLMAPAALAAVLPTDKLLITDLDVKVGGKSDKNIEDESSGYTIDREAQPGDKVVFTIEVFNNFTNLEDKFKG